MPLALRLYRGALRRCPPEFRAQYEEEMIDALDRTLRAERDSRGRMAALLLWIRAMADVVSTARRERRPWGMSGGLWRDVRYAGRMARRHPGFATVVVVTLALGIGGVTAVFTLADPVLFRPLPFPHADRLVHVWLRGTPSGYPLAGDYFKVAERAQSLELVSSTGGPVSGRFRDLPDDLLGIQVTRNYLELLGQQPAIGRGFLAEEYPAPREQPAVAVITYQFWRQAFGGRSDIVGQSLELGGIRPRSLRIVGVLPESFIYPDATNRAPVFLQPWSVDPAWSANPNLGVEVIARLRSGVTPEQAAAELQPLVAESERENAKVPRNRVVSLNRVQDELFRSLRAPLWTLFAATTCILFLACVNLTHFALARGSSRARELAVRQALGAGRRRLIGQLTIEAAGLCVAGAALGLGLGQMLFRWGMRFTPTYSHIYRLMPGGLDGRVAAAALLLGLVALFFIGIWPAVFATRTNLRSTIADVPRTRWRGVPREGWITMFQAGFTVAVLVMCALVVRSFIGIVTRPLGYDPDGFRVLSIRGSATLDGAGLIAFHERIVESLSRVPGVAAAGVTNGTPHMTSGFPVTDAAGQPLPNLRAFAVSAGVPTVMGMPLEAGRLFTETEGFRNAPLALVDRRAAELLWPDQEPLGRTLTLRGASTYTVVGILARQQDLAAEQSGSGLVLVPLDPATMRAGLEMVRFAGRPVSRDVLLGAIRQVDPALTMGSVSTMSSYDRFVGQPRFLASVLGTLGGLTILLAIVGIAGVVGHSVARRTREIGIRLALGADRRRVRTLIVRRALGSAAVGVTCGLIVAFWWAATLKSVLVGMDPHDGWSFVLAAAGTLGLVAIGSAWPAIKASGVDPIVTLRAE
jgi:putative ABC transport system permease protein